MIQTPLRVVVVVVVVVMRRRAKARRRRAGDGAGGDEEGDVPIGCASRAAVAKGDVVGGGGGALDDDGRSMKMMMNNHGVNGVGNDAQALQQQQRRKSHDLATTTTTTTTTSRASMDGAGTTTREMRETRETRGGGARGEEKRGEKRLTYAPLIAWAVILASASAMREVATRASALASASWVLGGDSPALARPDAFATDWFDDVFVSYGPILPFLAMGSRAMLRVQSRDIGEELAKEVRVYVVIAAFRIGAYATLRALFPRAFISDHVFLGASVFTAAHGEFLSSAVDFLTLVERRGNPLLRTGVMLVGAYALALMCATASLCFVTARWFHNPIDTAFAVFFGWFTLQLPMTSAIVRPRAHELATALAL